MPIFPARMSCCVRSNQIFAALGLIELDGVAARIVIAPPDINPEHLPAIVERAGVETVVSNDPALAIEGVNFARLHLPRPGAAVAPSRKSEWVLFTSGTTGIPKMVAHSLEALTGAIPPATAQDIVWGTFYDIRRYGGLQILLRALLGHASLILSDADESAGDFLERLGRHGVTHLTGTPSHWRRALMSPANAAIHPRYVRLSGEIADQADSGQSESRAFPACRSAMPMPRPKPAWALKSRTGWKAFRRPLVGASRARRIEGGGRAAACPLAAHRQPLCRQRRCADRRWLGQ